MDEKPTAMETITGGMTLVVTLENGTTESVTIRQLRVRELPALAQAIESEADAADLYCGKPSGWSDSLTLDSLEKVIEEGERVNADFFARWVQRNVARQERLFPGITEKRLAALLRSTTGLQTAPSRLASPSPKPASTP